jgi:NAD(P)-dependent dehydrogenase (short-subunit alcohol dehydrogenase family)
VSDEPDPAFDPPRQGTARRREQEMLLKDKVAVIYGAGGAVGGAVARAFATDGATTFLTGRHLPVEVVAKEVRSAGGSAEAAEVDALDEQASTRIYSRLSTRRVASTSRSTRSASRIRRFWVSR